jgi:GNAT superfamily N-acetyltransferase
MDPVVRLAAPGDARPLAVLEAEARAALVGARGGDRWLDEHPAVGEGWAAAITSGDVFVAVLEVGDGPGLVVGYLVVESELPIARIDQVYVTPDARELGFGDALLEAATKAATAAGATVLEGTALPGDRETKNLYERAGITARLIIVSRALAVSDPSTAAPASR